MSVSSTVVEYRLDAWPDDARATLATLVSRAAVPSEWRSSSLMVDGGHRAEVDALVAPLDHHAAPVDDLKQVFAGWYFLTRSASSRGVGGTAGSGSPTARRPRARSSVRGCPSATTTSTRSAAASSRWPGSSAVSRSRWGFRSRPLRSEPTRIRWASCAPVRPGSGAGFSARVCLRFAAAGRTACATSASQSCVASTSAWARSPPLSRGSRFVALVCVLVFSRESFRTTNSPTTGIEPSLLAAIVITLIVCVGAPFFEELFFRGLVQGVLTRRWGARIAIVAQALGFALVHYRIGMTLALALTTWVQIAVAGLVLGVLRWRYERLGPVWSRSAFNAIAVAIVFATWWRAAPGRRSTWFREDKGLRRDSRRLAVRTSSSTLYREPNWTFRRPLDVFRSRLSRRSRASVGSSFTVTTSPRRRTTSPGRWPTRSCGSDLRAPEPCAARPWRTWLPGLSRAPRCGPADRDVPDRRSGVTRSSGSAWTEFSKYRLRYSALMDDPEWSAPRAVGPAAFGP